MGLSPWHPVMMHTLPGLNDLWINDLVHSGVRRGGISLMRTCTTTIFWSTTNNSSVTYLPFWLLVIQGIVGTLSALASNGKHNSQTGDSFWIFLSVLKSHLKCHLIHFLHSISGHHRPTRLNILYICCTLHNKITDDLEPISVFFSISKESISFYSIISN